MNNRIKDKVKSVLEKDPDLKLALIFGSYARGDEHASSDLDIAVAYKNTLDMNELITIGQKISQQINLEVDIVDLREATGVLLQQIMKDRITLVNRDSELYGNIISRRVTEESDYMPLRDNMLAIRRERFLNGKANNKSKD
jgi:predicted nucleotidyltransferase